MSDETEVVQTLAEQPCPSTTCEDGHWFDVPNQPCELCHGTGALVAGLRRECDHSWMPTCTCGYRDDEGCETCDDLMVTCCRRRGWTLIPAAEQMGVLVRAWKDISLEQGEGSWTAFIEVNTGGTEIAKGDTPEEALAHAILQALGVAGEFQVG